MNQDFNTRILVIDDEENVRDSFCRILQPHDSKHTDYSKLNKASSVLFNTPDNAEYGSVKRSSATFNFEFNEASSGKQGYEMIKAAVEENRPYAAVFVDMRMPGWDGVETVGHIREVDKRCEIIFVTAYSDYSIKEIVTSVGTNISYHCKPFSVEEIEQIATKAVYEWNKTKNLEELIRTISELRAQNWQMEPLMENILQQVSYLMGTHSAMIALMKDGGYKKLLAIGNLCDESVADYYLQNIAKLPDNEVFQNDNFAYFRLNKYGIIAIFEKGGKPLNQERTYLVRLFLEQAVMSIQNVGLQEQILKQEKLSAVGQGLSMLSHDLRSCMANVIMGTEMLQEKITDDADASELIGLMNDSANQGLQMISDVLDFIRNKPECAKQLISLDTFIADIENMVASILKESNTNLEVTTPGDITFMGNESKLERVFVNLIRNACEAMDENNAHKHVLLKVTKNKDNLLFEVTDNGSGIPRDIIDSIYEPFVTSGKPGGSGLGLAISKQFIEAHGGSISVKSSKEGTVFTVILPGQ